MLCRASASIRNISPVALTVLLIVVPQLRFRRGFILKQDPDGRRISIVILPVADCPQEGAQKAAGYYHTEDDQHYDDCHTIEF